MLEKYDKYKYTVPVKTQLVRVRPRTGLSVVGKIVKLESL